MFNYFGVIHSQLFNTKMTIYCLEYKTKVHKALNMIA